LYGALDTLLAHIDASGVPLMDKCVYDDNDKFEGHGIREWSNGVHGLRLVIDLRVEVTNLDARMI